MLAHINVPKYLFDKIYKWAFHHNINKPYSQKSLVKDMRNIIQTPDIYPTRISVVIAEDYSVDMYLLLMDTNLTSPKNLNFGDDPLEGPIWGEQTPLGDLNTSFWWYYKTCEEPVPIMIRHFIRR